MVETCQQFTQLLENTPENLLGGNSHLRKESQKTNVPFCPKSFTMAEGPKANTVREKCKELKELRDKCRNHFLPLS